MSEIVRQGGALQVIQLTGGRVAITGPPARVAAALDRLRLEGRLAGATDPAPTADGGVLVTVRLVAELTRPPVAAAAAAVNRWTPRRVGLAAGAAAAALLVPCIAAYLVVSWIAAHAAVVIGALVAVAILAVAIGPRVCQTVITITHRH